YVLSATQWSIAGKVLAVTPKTEIGAGIQVGSLVDVSASTAADGSLTALHIKLDNEDHSGGAIQPNSNDNGSHSGEDHGGNTNINSNQNENENGDNNGNTNSNENDDHSGNTNSNSNENDSHSGETGQVVRLTAIA
ncbi:MAG TPA: DUF5666 domain-containing protein, partial [Anaerolineales bacterium]